MAICTDLHVVSGTGFVIAMHGMLRGAQRLYYSRSIAT
jgi:hypothetical protein